LKNFEAAAAIITALFGFAGTVGIKGHEYHLINDFVPYILARLPAIFQEYQENQEPATAGNCCASARQSLPGQRDSVRQQGQSAMQGQGLEPQLKAWPRDRAQNGKQSEQTV